MMNKKLILFSLFYNYLFVLIAKYNLKIYLFLELYRSLKTPRFFLRNSEIFPFLKGNSSGIPCFSSKSFRWKPNSKKLIDYPHSLEQEGIIIMTNQKEGLWAHFIDLIPIPERSEVLSLIGRSLMDTNEVRKHIFHFPVLFVTNSSMYRHYGMKRLFYKKLFMKYKENQVFQVH